MEKYLLCIVMHSTMTYCLGNDGRWKNDSTRYNHDFYLLCFLWHVQCFVLQVVFASSNSVGILNVFYIIWMLPNQKKFNMTLFVLFIGLYPLNRVIIKYVKNCIYCCYAKCTTLIVRVLGMHWPFIGSTHLLPCTVRTFRQRSCNRRVDFLQKLGC